MLNNKILLLWRQARPQHKIVTLKNRSVHLRHVVSETILTSNEGPLQFGPPLLGTGFVHCLDLVEITPSPQVALGDDHSDHAVHPPGTAARIKIQQYWNKDVHVVFDLISEGNLTVTVFSNIVYDEQCQTRNLDQRELSCLRWKSCWQNDDVGNSRGKLYILYTPFLMLDGHTQKHDRYSTTLFS